MFSAAPWARFARVLLVTLASAATALSLVGCPSDASDERPGPGETVSATASDQTLAGTPEVKLSVGAAPLPDGQYRTFANSGSGAVQVSVANLNGGVLTAAADRGDGPGYSIRTPRFNPDSSARRAVVKITNSTATDVLNPRTNAFSFGADFAIDAESWSSAFGSTDNGDNLVQRGLHADSTQYKLQLDHHVATCVVKGALGSVEVASSVAIQSDRWYRASCQRLVDRVSISVTFWLAGGSPKTVTNTRRGRTGDLTPARASWPLSVGGKLQSGGAIDPSTDQFNGRIDNVLLQIG